MAIRFGIRNRLLFLVGIMLIFMGGVVSFFVYQASGTKDQMIAKVGQIMNADARDKIMVATTNMASSLGSAVEGMTTDSQRIDTISRLINNIRFEEDKSGYFFVYQETVCRVLPTKKELEGKDLGGNKDVNGLLYVQELRKAGSWRRWICRVRVRQAWQRRSAQNCLLDDDPRH